MAIKGLEDRFNAKIKELYQGSAKIDGSNNPILEYKPTDKDARETQHDSRELPVGSVKRDLKRMSKFMLSFPGLQFYAIQSLLQANNAFTETRIINPLFVVANTQPYAHFGRNLANPSDFLVKGDAKKKSPASTIEIGHAGRLQKHTSREALARATGTGGSSGLLGLLSPIKIVKIVTDAFSVATGGSTGMDARPEFKVDGSFYSIAVWKGFKKQISPASNLNAAKANLRVGNITGAVNSVKAAASSFLNGIRPKGLTAMSAPQGRNDPLNMNMNGRRYFITNNNKGADRYLHNSMQWDADDRPEPTVAYLDRKSRAIVGTRIAIPPIDDSSDGAPGNRTTVEKTKKLFGSLNSVAKKATKTAENTKKNIQSQANHVASQLEADIRRAIPVAGAGTSFSLPTFDVTAPIEGESGNPAFDHMPFPELSLQYRYDSSDAAAGIKSILELQKKSQFAYWEANKVDRGFDGGLKAGVDSPLNGNVRNSAPSYLKDRSNSVSVFKNRTGTDISDKTIKDIHDAYGEDLINVFFYDFVNHLAIPFRAFISNLQWNVTPEISDTRYIGRVDRNIVYVGVNREVSFNLHVQAFSSEELAVIWRKINYVTGLCFPSRYDEYGFMIPPFMKLTIGDIFRDQPGYLKSVSNVVEDGRSWEITPDHQAPQGVVMSMTYAILEKTQMDAGSMFYPVGTSRAISNGASLVGQLSDSLKTNMGTKESRPLPNKSVLT